MSQTKPNPKLGTVGWLDLTVDDAGRLRDFYAAVCGWTPKGVAMGEGTYEDFAMQDADGRAVAGVCFRRDENAKLPPVWIPYVVVEDLDASVAAAIERGAGVIDDRRPHGGTMVVLKDPAGAVFSLFAPGDAYAFDPNA